MPVVGGVRVNYVVQKFANKKEKVANVYKQKVAKSNTVKKAVVRQIARALVRKRVPLA